MTTVSIFITMIRMHRRKDTAFRQPHRKGGAVTPRGFNAGGLTARVQVVVGGSMPNLGACQLAPCSAIHETADATEGTCWRNQPRKASMPTAPAR
jgi:hypothetical protein